MRADARRNRHAVLEAGARLLAERSTASMQEIADASGVGRTTVYRHFPAREDLLSALVEQVSDEVIDRSAAALSGGDPAPQALRRLAADVVNLGVRWRFLRDQRTRVLSRIQQSDRDFLEWVAAAQRRGELRSDFDPEWIVAATRGLMTA